MGGRRRLVADAPRMLGLHGGVDGRAFRRAWTALASEFGKPAPRSLARLEMGRVAALWVALEAATLAQAEARRRRQEGRGRRPSPRELERLARRAGLADQSYAAAVERLRQLCTARRNASPDELLDRVHAAMAADHASEGADG